MGAAQVLAEEEGVVAGSSGRTTLVVGLGDTGLAVARYLAADRLLVIDSREQPPTLDALRASRPDARVEVGSLDIKWLDQIDRVVLSPGLSSDIPLVAEARRRGLPVLSDIELFAEAATAPVLAVTGSNGKSTVVTLVRNILRAAGRRVLAGGNLGPPALDLLAEPEPDAYVLEVSSFQMETTQSLHAHAAAVLNISADHLDRHGSIEQYAALKERLLASASYGVFNWDDPMVRAMGQRHPRPVAVSVDAPLDQGFSIVEVDARRWLARDGRAIIASDELGLVGRHNEANALVALALCLLLEADAAAEVEAAACEVLRRFRGLPHRCQQVAEKSGVVFVDDSKGTNVGASVAALQSLAAPVVLIAGGQGKRADFAALATAARDRLRAAVLIGEAAASLAAVLGPVCPVEMGSSMDDAVTRAARLARPGDVVLLSPACASQDMFRDYRERGEVFVRAVLRLPA